MEKLILNLFSSKADSAGNVYWAFQAINPAGNKEAFGTISGSKSNITGAEFLVRGRWPEAGESRWLVNHAELGIRKWNKLVKGWPYAGCKSADILAFIQKTIEPVTPPSEKATAHTPAPRPLCIFGDYNYLPITPQADTHELANVTPRIVLQHRRNYERGADIILAKQGEMVFGWVIGIVNPNALPFTYQSEHAALCVVAEFSQMFHRLTGEVLDDIKSTGHINKRLANDYRTIKLDLESAQATLSAIRASQAVQS